MIQIFEVIHHMTEKTLSDHIIDIITDEQNKLPTPTTCEVIKNYTNEPSKVDVKTPYGELRYIDCLNSNSVGRKGILIYIDNDYNKPIAIMEARTL